MHTVNTLQQSLALAESLGYAIRFEYLGRAAGGVCEVLGRRWLFVDLALSPAEQLDQVLDALREDPRMSAFKLPHGARLGSAPWRRCA